MSAVLIVLDDPERSRQIGTYLGQNGFMVHKAADAAGMRQALGQDDFDLVILDAQLPDGSSLATCRGLAAAGGPPVMMMGAGEDEIERIVGLEVGAEDYVARSVHPRELLARVRVATRRRAVAPRPDPAHVYALRGLELDIVHRQLSAPGLEPLRLTPAEVGMVAGFIQGKGAPISRAELRAIALRGDKPVLDGAVDTQISRLRRKLTAWTGSDPIQTIHGIGYVWSAILAPSRAAGPGGVEIRPGSEARRMRLV